MGLRALVLGAAAGGGLPQWNCRAGGSGAYWASGGTAPSATQSSLAVSADGAAWCLMNASPDLRAQILARPELQPRAEAGLRSSPIASVVLTNDDVDHIAGLLSLRERLAFRLIATAEVAAVLAANPIFGVLDPALVPRETVPLGAPIAILPGVEATLFPVPGKVALYLEAETVDTALEGEQTVGVEITDGTARFFYIPGCAAMTPALADRLRGADLVFFDGTLWRDDEMIAAGVGHKTGRRMGHMPISGPGGALEAFADLGVGRKIFVHMNGTNPVWQPGPERAAVEAAGWEIAFDGMEVRP